MLPREKPAEDNRGRQRAAAFAAAENQPPVAVHPSADIAADVVPGAFCSVGAGARLGAGTVLQDHVVVGAGVTVGRDCRLHPHVVLYPGVSLGDRCEIHSGTAVGADCYGHEDSEAGGSLVKPPAPYSVVIGDDVEVGVNCSIERGQQRDTQICDSVKIGDLVVVAHDCHIGIRARLTAQVGLASNVTLGDDVMLMGQVGVRGGVTIGDRVVVFAKSGVCGDLPGDAQYFGYPARPHREALRAMALARSLPRLWRALLKGARQNPRGA